MKKIQITPRSVRFLPSALNSGKLCPRDAQKLISNVTKTAMMLSKRGMDSKLELAISYAGASMFNAFHRSGHGTFSHVIDLQNFPVGGFTLEERDFQPFVNALNTGELSFKAALYFCSILKAIGQFLADIDGAEELSRFFDETGKAAFYAFQHSDVRKVSKGKGKRATG